MLSNQGCVSTWPKEQLTVHLYPTCPQSLVARMWMSRFLMVQWMCIPVMTFLLPLKSWLGVFPAFLLLFSQELLTSIITDPHFFSTLHLSYFASFFFPTDNMGDTSAPGCNSSPAVHGFLQTAGQVNDMGQHMGCCVYSSTLRLGPPRLLWGGTDVLMEHNVWWHRSMAWRVHGMGHSWWAHEGEGRTQAALGAFPWPPASKPNPSQVTNSMEKVPAGQPRSPAHSFPSAHWVSQETWHHLTQIMDFHTSVDAFTSRFQRSPQSSGPSTWLLRWDSSGPRNWDEFCHSHCVKPLGSTDKLS